MKREYCQSNLKPLSTQYCARPSRLLGVLTEILIDLEAAIDSYDVSQDAGLTKPGMYVWSINEVSPLQPVHVHSHGQYFPWVAVDLFSTYSTQMFHCVRMVWIIFTTVAMLWHHHSVFASICTFKLPIWDTFCDWWTFVWWIKSKKPASLSENFTSNQSIRHSIEKIPSESIKYFWLQSVPVSQYLI